MNRVFLPAARAACVSSLALFLASFASLAGAADVPHAAAAVKVDPARGGALYDSGDNARGLPACVSCHGAGGNSSIVANPKLAGQSDSYLHKQLVDFTTPNRNQPVMTTYAKMLSEDEKKNIAAWLATQPSLAGSRVIYGGSAGPGLLTELEDRLAITIEDDEVDGEMLETFGALVEFAANKALV